LTTDAQRRVRELFDSALDQPAELRQKFLAEACNGDQQLLKAVVRLLAAQERSAGVLDTPVRQRRLDNTGPAAPGSFVGPYKILRELGGGGMGIVYQAVRADEVFQRICAIKVIRPELSSDLLQQRFRDERQILGRLDHVNIARILDGGSTQDGLPYFVMDYVDGPGIGRFCDEHELGTRGRLVLFLQVCAAVSYLHQNGVIHGDLKPPNILVGNHGAVKLVDFGIASAITAPETNSQDKALPLMTPGYASPEQMRGEGLTPASDVYSLAVILYELLSGSKPFAKGARSRSEMLNVLATEDPTPPSVAAMRGAEHLLPSGHDRIGRALRGDLDSVVLRGMHRDSASRYSTVAELGDDINHYLQNRPVTSRKGGMIYKSRKFIHRQRRATLAAFAICILLTTASWQGVELHKHYRRSQQLEERVRVLESQLNDEMKERKAQMVRPTVPGRNTAPNSQEVEELKQLQVRDVNNLTQAYRTSFSESVRLWPGMTPKRRELLDHAEGYLRQAEPFVSQDPAALGQLANAWLWLANIQGNPQTVNLHDHAGAAASIGEAERLLGRSPGASTDLIDQVNEAMKRIGADRKQ
jgi:serine/threonine protein kinase